MKKNKLFSYFSTTFPLYLLIFSLSPNCSSLSFPIYLLDRKVDVLQFFVLNFTLPHSHIFHVSSYLLSPIFSYFSLFSPIFSYFSLNGVAIPIFYLFLGREAIPPGLRQECRLCCDSSHARIPSGIPPIFITLLFKILFKRSKECFNPHFPSRTF